MLNTFKLLLPALIPSWRFFDTITPSPRIEFALLEAAEDTPADWQEFRPKPARLPFSFMLKRLFWNPQWNESLFLVSCAERLIAAPAENAAREIAARIKAELECNPAAFTARPWLRFRLAVVSREGTQMQRHVAFVSHAYDTSRNTE